MFICVGLLFKCLQDESPWAVGVSPGSTVSCWHSMGAFSSTHVLSDQQVEVAFRGLSKGQACSSAVNPHILADHLHLVSVAPGFSGEGLASATEGLMLSLVLQQPETASELSWQQHAINGTELQCLGSIPHKDVQSENFQKLHGFISLSWVIWSAIWWGPRFNWICF